VKVQRTQLLQVGTLVLCLALTLLVVGLLWIINSPAHADIPLERIPTLSSIPDTATDLAATMDIPFEAAHQNNFSTGRTATIDSIVIHYCAGNFRSCKDTFKNKDSGVSAHYVISKQGDIVQMVGATYNRFCRFPA
jgi:hypothetical protein